MLKQRSLKQRSLLCMLPGGKSFQPDSCQEGDSCKNKCWLPSCRAGKYHTIAEWPPCCCLFQPRTTLSRSKAEVSLAHYSWAMVVGCSSIPAELPFWCSASRINLSSHSIRIVLWHACTTFPVPLCCISSSSAPPGLLAPVLWQLH